MNRILQGLGILLAAMLAAVPAQAQESGPIEPPPKFEVKRIPATPNPGAPPLPADEIIRRFTQNEDRIKKAYDAETFVQAVKVKELADQGGEFSVTGQVYTKRDGQRYERIPNPAVTTLQFTAFSTEDVKTLARIPLFALTTDHLPLYRLTYEGQEKLDQINTFVFRVQPKQLELHRRLFEGVVWVDDQDLAIVKSYGQFISASGDAGYTLPFKMFETYRENLQGHLWFPTYVTSDDHLKTPQGDVLLQLVIRSTDFKLQSPLAPASPQSPAPSKPALPPQIESSGSGPNSRSGTEMHFTGISDRAACICTAVGERPITPTACLPVRKG